MTTPSRRPRRFLRATPLFGLLMLASACRSSPTPTATPRETGQLVLQLRPKTASVVLDERPLLVPRSDGEVALGLPAGAHRIEVFAPGYFTAYRDVKLVPGSPVTLQVELRADPDAAPDTAPARPFGPRPAPIEAP